MVDGMLVVVLLSTCANSAVLYVGASVILQQLRDIRAQLSEVANRFPLAPEVTLSVLDKAEHLRNPVSEADEDTEILDEDAGRLDEEPKPFPPFEGTPDNVEDTLPLVTAVMERAQIIADYGTDDSMSRSGELEPKAYSGLGKWMWGRDNALSSGRPEENRGDPDPGRGAE